MVQYRVQQPASQLEVTAGSIDIVVIAAVTDVKQSTIMVCHIVISLLTIH